MTVAILGIILSLGLLMYLAFRGFSVIAIAPLLALLAVVIAGIGMGESFHVMASYTEVFMAKLGGYIKANFPIFLLGAILGKFLEDSGSADSISRTITNLLGKNFAILAVVLSSAILTYGGVSLFVVAFASYPIGARLFKEAGIPKRFLPGAIALGAFTFTMTALPGTPQIQNSIPMKYFGTDAFAAPVLGIVASLIIGCGGVFWLTWRSKRAMARGEGYGEHDESNLAVSSSTNDKPLPNFFLAMVPILIVLVLNFVLSKMVYTNMDLSYLTEGYAIENPSSVIGTWSLIISLVVGILATVILNYKRFDNVLKSLTNGVSGSFLAIFNTASETGYGNVIASLSVFTVISGFLLHISSNPLINEAIAVSSLAGITGSASGGLSIALDTVGADLLKEALRLGISPEVLHRVASIACGAMDTLPHNGAVITLLGITGMTHRKSYADIGMCTVILPTIAVTVVIILASFGIV